MDEFYALSQITITIAGFAALFSILKPQKGEWKDIDNINLVRFYMMIELACIVSIFSYLPVILLGYFSNEITFRLSFGILFIISFLYDIFAIKRVKKRLKISPTGRKAKFSLLIIIGLLFLLFELLGAVNCLGSNYKTNYLIILFSKFILNVYFFIRLIYFSTQKK